MLIYLIVFLETFVMYSFDIYIKLLKFPKYKNNPGKNGLIKPGQTRPVSCKILIIIKKITAIK